MSDFRKISASAVAVLIVLRLCIGWQFFYEGLWKLETFQTSRPWSAAGYLKNSRGPLRPFFRNLMEDPDDLNWLDEKWVSQRWDDWKQRFSLHYKLTEEQKQQLEELLDGTAKIVANRKYWLNAPLDERLLRIGGTLARKKILRLEKYEEHTADGKVSTWWRLVLDGRQHLTPREYAPLERQARDAEQTAAGQAQLAEKPEDRAYWKQQEQLIRQFRRALADLSKRNKRLAAREKLKALLKGDPERVGTAVPAEENGEDSVSGGVIGKIEEYKRRLKRREEMLTGARTGFQWDHLQKEEKRIAALHSELIGPVKQLEADLQRTARALLTEDQLALGAVPIALPGRIDRINHITIWSLLILGGLLLVGLFSRSAALLGGLLVLSFYLAMPPWPNVPQPPGPEHSLFVNKNLLEVLALFSLALIPTGRFFGLDVFLTACCRRGSHSENPRNRKSAETAGSASSSKGDQNHSFSQDEKSLAGKTKENQSVVAASTGSGGETYPLKEEKEKTGT